MQAGGGQQGSGHAVLIFSVFIKHHSPARTERQQAEQDKAPRYCHWQGTDLPLPAPSTNPVPRDILEQKVPMLLIHDEPREHSPMHPPRAEPELRGGAGGKRSEEGTHLLHLQHFLPQQAHQSLKTCLARGITGL